jgi:ubiquinone/menaquinone biosynthesis C-methylase UbiE
MKVEKAEHPAGRVSTFLTEFESLRPAYFSHVANTARSDPTLFSELAEPMLQWAEATLGPKYIETLIKGYCEFVTDVNRSQLRYEATGTYEVKSYEDVFHQTYDSQQFMSLYHWGVYTTTFAWAHHLELYAFFRDQFLSRLAARSSSGQIIDLGCGSGIWHLLTLRHLENWSATAIDISETSVALTKKMCGLIAPRPAVTHIVGDALSFQPSQRAQAGISCFLLEHLEEPFALLENLARCSRASGISYGCEFVRSPIRRARIELLPAPFHGDGVTESRR